MAFPREGERCVQNQLTYLGFNPGPVDGFVGPQTRAAAQAWKDAQRIGDDPRFPDLTDVTALQWCREIGMMTYPARQFWPSRSDVRFIARDAASEFEARFLEEITREARRYFGRNHNLWLAGSFDVIGGETEDELRPLMENARRERALNFRLNQDVRLCSPEGLAGLMYLQTIAICLVPDEDEEDTYPGFRTSNLFGFRVAAHEYMHLIQFELANQHLVKQRFKPGEKYFGPDWMVEGTAMYFDADFAQRFNDAREIPLSRLVTMARSSGLSLSDLRDQRTVLSWSDYQFTHLAARLLVQRFGEDSLFDYWRALGATEDQDNAFQATFGMTLAEFEAEFEVLVDDFRLAYFYGSEEAGEDDPPEVPPAASLLAPDAAKTVSEQAKPQ